MTLEGFARQPIQGYPNGIHKPVDLWRGDTWLLLGKLFNSSMTSQDLTDATIQWLLMDQNAQQVQSLSIGFGITIASDTTTGQLTILIVDSPEIPHGNYWDRLIVTIAGVVTTYWVGQIRIHDQFMMIDDLGLAGLR